jgi:hypothetical protein
LLRPTQARPSRAPPFSHTGERGSAKFNTGGCNLYSTDKAGWLGFVALPAIGLEGV